MPVIGEKISAQQKFLLARARAYDNNPRELIQVFSNILNDDDIQADRDQIHPEWLNIFEANKGVFEQIGSVNFYKKIGNFFEQLLPFDNSIRDLNPVAMKISFLLGAGVCKPEPSNIPTVKELLPQLLERARRLDRDDVTKLADFCERRKIDNIEDLLTAAQLATFCSRNPTVLRLLNYLLYRGDTDEPFDVPRFDSVRLKRFREPAADLSSVAFLQDTLQVLFGLLSSTMLPAKPNHAHEAIAKYAKEHLGSSIVTTNYDCCMDLALGEIGKDFLYQIDFANLENHQSVDLNCSKLIKLHGSLNWFYCETCQEVQLIDIRQIVKDFLEDKGLYPVIGICKDCGGQRRGLLVPPLAMKFDVAPPLTPLLSHAKAAFDKADLIVVVGFSFAEADIYISRMLSKAMQMANNQKLLIVDPEHRVVDRIRRRFKASIPNFDSTRIIRLSGDCADKLPKFLAGDFYSKRDETDHKKILNDGDRQVKQRIRKAKVIENINQTS